MVSASWLLLLLLLTWERQELRRWWAHSERSGDRTWTMTMTRHCGSNPRRSDPCRPFRPCWPGRQWRDRRLADKWRRISCCLFFSDEPTEVIELQRGTPVIYTIFNRKPTGPIIYWRQWFFGALKLANTLVIYSAGAITAKLLLNC